jgi:membrane protein DedA with SNARE-associated domain
VIFQIAAITDKLVDFAVNVVGDLGLAGIFVLMLLESACIPIPSEATMLFAGFNVANGEYSLFAAVAAGVLGNLVGSWIAYGVGYFGRVEWFEKHGHHIFIKPHHIAWADDWFTRHGEATVFFARMIPIIRTFISLPAGVARMPLVKFVVYTLAGCIPWVLALAIIGREVGDRWDEWKNYLHYFDYAVIAAIAIAIVYLLVRRRRGSAKWETTPPA